MKSEKSVKWPVKVWFLLHCTLIILYSMPTGPNSRRSANLADDLRILNDKYIRQSPVHYYFAMTGTWQYWDMFAPDPLQIDYWCEAAVEFADGSVKTGYYPRIKTLPLYEKYFKERFRKYLERAHLESASYLWGPFAHRVALNAYTDPNNPPVRVTLIRHWRRIGPPQNDPGVGQYREYAYYPYVVDEEQLKRDKAGL